jgi:ribosomal protein L3 glutamine methyltransferase
MLMNQAELRTARDWVTAGEEAFAAADLYYGHGADNPLDDALALVRFAAGIHWQAEEESYDQSLTQAVCAQISDLFERRIKERLPVPYLTGEAWFAGLPFKVTPDVLIPRSPFAELILEGFQPWLADTDPKRILDLCTGSGCIAIACAYAFPQARVTGTDLSSAALAVAEENRVAHELEERLNLIEADVFAGLPPERYELIVSNPPYVPDTEMATLPDEYRHEPALALRADDDGLAIVERILLGAPDYLSVRGWLAVEVGNSQDAVERRWPDLPLTWLEFERGGDGVFIISAQELSAWAAAQDSA